MACKGSWLGSALPCPAGRSGPWSRRTGAPMASATGRDRNPRVCSRLAHETVGHRQKQRGKSPVGKGEGASREASTAPDEHLGTAVQRLITLRSRLQEPSAECQPECHHCW